MKVLKSVFILVMLAAVAFTGCNLNGSASVSEETVTEMEGGNLLPICEINAGEGSTVDFYEVGDEVYPFIFATSEEMLKQLSNMTIEEICNEYNDGNIPNGIESVMNTSVGMTTSKSLYTKHSFSSGILTADYAPGMRKMYKQAHNITTPPGYRRIAVGGRVYNNVNYAYQPYYFTVVFYYTNGTYATITKRVTSDPYLTKGFDYSGQLPTTTNKIYAYYETADAHHTKSRMDWSITY